MKTIYVVTGQTASGKTSYAINLAKELNGELINADSRQIYKHMDIVTGKDLHLTQGAFQLVNLINGFDIGYYMIPMVHSKIWLYDIGEPNIHFSAFDYKICALNCIEKIFNNQKVPIIVGGSYLYIKNLLFNTIDIHVPPDVGLRAELSELSVDDLQTKLNKINSAILNTMNESDRKNPHRLIRKIEILSNAKSQNNDTSSIPIAEKYNIKLIGFRHKDPIALEKLIEKRINERIENGAFDEVKKLQQMNFTDETPGLNAIGYKQIISYLNENISYDELISEWKTKEVQYAKRQYSFMKQNENINWINK